AASWSRVERYRCWRGHTALAVCYAWHMPLLPTADPCATGEDICNKVYDWTGNETAAEAANLFIGKPLALLTLLVIGLVVRWLLHRVVDRLMRRAEHGVLPDRVSPAVTARRVQRAM